MRVFHPNSTVQVYNGTLKVDFSLIDCWSISGSTRGIPDLCGRETHSVLSR